MKAVTIMSFGPSLKLPYAGEGEFWSMNSCWDLFRSLPWANRISRIYEMHQLDKRKDLVSEIDGVKHLDQLSWLGSQGVRIVLQEQSEQITNSEAYPLAQIEEELGTKAIEAYTGLDFWGGTPPYLLAQAIYEGYESIHLVGCDMLDLKHRRQRMGMLYLWGIAKERGIDIQGITAYSGRETIRYGYDYGPEWDARQQNELWEGSGINLQIAGYLDPNSKK